MREFLDDHLGLFDPDQVPVLVAAFDGAWESAQTSAVIFDTDVNTEAAWLILAKHIIEAAKQGELDQRRLRDGALVAWTRYLRSAPYHPRRRPETETQSTAV